MKVLMSAVLLTGFGFAAVATLEQDSPVPGTSLDELSWLAGTWVQASETRLVQEVWLEPLGGMMLGVNHDVDLESDTTRAFEYLRIVATPDGIDYVASPGGTLPTSFRLIESENGRVLFSNPEHDFPKRVGYRMEGEELVAWIEGDDGKPREWRWKRSP